MSAQLGLFAAPTKPAPSPAAITDPDDGREVCGDCVAEVSRG